MIESHQTLLSLPFINISYNLTKNFMQNIFSTRHSSSPFDFRNTILPKTTIIVYNIYIYIYFLLLSWIMIPCLNWTNMTKKRHQYCLILSIGHFRESFLPPWHVTLQLCSCVISHLTWITKTRGGYILYICSKSINTL